MGVNFIKNNKILIIYNKKTLVSGWMDGWKEGWVEGWMDGWMEGKAGLRIAYSNQKRTEQYLHVKFERLCVFIFVGCLIL